MIQIRKWCRGISRLRAKQSFGFFFDFYNAFLYVLYIFVLFVLFCTFSCFRTFLYISLICTLWNKSYILYMLYIAYMLYIFVHAVYLYIIVHFYSAFFHKDWRKPEKSLFWTNMRARPSCTEFSTTATNPTRVFCTGILITNEAQNVEKSRPGLKRTKVSSNGTSGELHFSKSIT